MLRALGKLFTGKHKKRVNDMLKQVNDLIAAAKKANAEGVMQGQPKFSLAGTEVGFILKNYDDIQDIATAVEAVVKRYPKDSGMLANVLSDYRQNADDDEFIQGLRTFAKYFGDKQERDRSEDKATIEETFGGIWIEDTEEFAKFVSAVNKSPFEEDGEGIAYTDNYFYAYYRNVENHPVPYASVYLNKDESQDVVNQVNEEIGNVRASERIKKYLDRGISRAWSDEAKNNANDGYNSSISNRRRNEILGSDILRKGRYFDNPSLYVKTSRTDRGNRVNYSLITPEMDASYLDAVERGDMETAQKMVMEADKFAMPNTKVVDEDGNPKVVYHQTNHSVYINRETGQNCDELDWRERMEWDERDDWDDYWEERDFYTFSRVNARTTQELDGFFFAPEYDEYHKYGHRENSDSYYHHSPYQH